GPQMTVTRSVWGFIERRDYRVMQRMNRWRAPRWIRYWMIAATRMGDGWLWYGLGIMLLVYGGPQRFSALGAAGGGAGGRGGCRRNFRLQSAQALESEAAAVPDRAALLVQGAASRSILVSFRAHHD